MANARACLAAYASLFLVLAPGFASAEIPTGSFEFQLGGANSLWMGGGVDTHEDADGFCASFGGGFDDVEFCDYELTVDGKGKIGGYVEFIGWTEGGTRVAIEGPIKGAQRGSNRTGITRAAFAIRLAGTARRDGSERHASVSLKLVAQIDAGGVMTGTWTQKSCLAGVGCETARWPAGPNTWENGHWTLALDVEDLGAGALGGSARILFGDDTSCDFALDGSYDAAKDTADVTLSPASPKCAGGSLRLRFLKKGFARTGGDAYLALLQFKLFGVTGATGVHTDVAMLHRSAFDSLFFVSDIDAPPFSENPTRPVISHGSSLLITVIQLPPVEAPPAQAASISLAASTDLVNLDFLLQSAIAAQAAAGTSGVMAHGTLPQ